MAFKTILIDLDDTDRDAARFDIAVGLAAQGESHLVGLYVIAPFYPTMGAFGDASAGLVADVQQSYLDDARASAERLHQRCEERAAKAGLPFEWRCEEGLPTAIVPMQARYADITVMGQPDADTLDPARPRDLPADVVLNSGRPTLVVPYAGTFKTVGERVLIAWNGSRESTRAVYDALPLLIEAKEVHVITINPPDETHIPGFDISAQLARHGVNAEAMRTVSRDVGVGDIILSEAADLDADLIVMGAYGRSRLRELILGGASRLVISSMTAPVLMSH